MSGITSADTPIDSSECDQKLAETKHPTTLFCSLTHLPVFISEASLLKILAPFSVTHYSKSFFPVSNRRKDYGTTNHVVYHLTIHHSRTAVFNFQGFPLSTDAKILSSILCSWLTSIFSTHISLSTNNNSSYVTDNPEDLSQQSSDEIIYEENTFNHFCPTMVNVQDIPQHSPRPPLQLSGSNRMPDRDCPAKVSILNELLARVKRITSDEHIQFNIKKVTTVQWRQAIKLETLNELVSSDVDGSNSRIEPDVHNAKIQDCMYDFVDLEAVSSSVDKDSMNSIKSCRNIMKITTNCADFEALSSAVDAIDLLQERSEIMMKSSTSSENDDQNFITDTEDLVTSKVLEIPSAHPLVGVSAAQAVTCVSDFQDGLEQHEQTCAVQFFVNNFENTLEVTVNEALISNKDMEILSTPDVLTGALDFKNKSEQQDIVHDDQFIRNNFENILQITVSETTISAQNRESLSEQTGVDISHSELPTDKENSESGVPVIEKSDVEQKSSLERSTSGSLSGLEKRQKHALVKNLRQRQMVISKIPADITEDYQMLPEQVSSVDGSHRIQAVSGDVLNAGQQQFHRHGLHSMLDQQPNQFQGRTRSRQPNTVYSSSIIVMIGLCLTTVYIVLNNLDFLVDVLTNW